MATVACSKPLHYRFCIFRFLILFAFFFMGFFSSVSCFPQHHSDKMDFYRVSAASNQPQELPWVEATLGTASLRLMIARTEAQKQTGLMFRRNLAPNEGMLFVYEFPHHMTFWMKNTYIPLDLVFFDQDLKVTETIEGMEPGVGIEDFRLPRYTSSMPAQYALELTSGSVKRLGIIPGISLQIPLPLLHSGE